MRARTTYSATAWTTTDKATKTLRARTTYSDTAWTKTKQCKIWELELLTQTQPGLKQTK